jgi:uncharacterized membrane protein YwaF
MYKIFDSFHLTYVIVSLVVVALILVLAKLYLKRQKAKNIFLLVCGVTTFALHISILWYDFYTKGKAEAYDNILFTIYPCNLIMYISFALSLSKRKNTKFYQGAAVFAFYVGIVGQFASLLYPTFYLSAGPDFNTIKSFLSHSFLSITCVWLVLGGYTKLRLTNIIPYSIGLAAGIALAALISLSFKLSGHGNYRSVMYIIDPAVPNTPFTIWVIAPISLVVYSLAGFLAEFHYPKEERSYIHFKVFDKKNSDGSYFVEESTPNT